MTPVEALKAIFQQSGYPGLLVAMDTHDYGSLTSAEISEVLSLPVGDVHKIEQKATRKLRHPAISRNFLDFMKDRES